MVDSSFVRRARLPLVAVALVLIVAALALAGCGKKASDSGATAGGGTQATESAPGSAERFSKGGSQLLEALTKPTDAIHFSFKGDLNSNNEWPRTAGAKPKVEPVTMEADVDSTQITLTTTGGGKTKTATAKKSSEMDWAMMPLAFLGPMTEVNMALAFASPVVHSTGVETVNGYQAEKFEFNTATASPTEKTGIEAAKKMLNGALEYGDIKGTTWVDKASGRMVKFNVDAQVHDKAGTACQEHMEGGITRK